MDGSCIRSIHIEHEGGNAREEGLQKHMDRKGMLWKILEGLEGVARLGAVLDAWDSSRAEWRKEHQGVRQGPRNLACGTGTWGEREAWSL